MGIRKRSGLLRVDPEFADLVYFIKANNMLKNRKTKTITGITKDIARKIKNNPKLKNEIINFK